MRNWLKIQYLNAFLYVPFVLAFGASVYFNMISEPNIPYVYLITVILGLGIILINKKHILLNSILLFAFGFCYAMTFTKLLNTPQISYDLRDLEIYATVTDIDYTADKPRILLRVNSQDLRLNSTDDANIRISVTDSVAVPKIGDTILANLNVFKPSPANAPGTFDMARWAYFNDITATGYMSSFTIINTAKNKIPNSIRAYIHNVANSKLTDGLVLGYKNALNKQEKSVWTSVGVGHIWSISGFHMTLVGGWIFAFFFALFRLISPITKRVPARKVALFFTIIGLAFYMLLSGASVATIRAFLMSLLVIIIFILGRGALSLRNISIVFCLLFFINPYYVMQAGFQLSFAAVYGITWFWTEVKPVLPKNNFLRFTSTAFLTALVATLFTMPITMTHFNSIPLYGILGNIILLPVFSFAIMPLVLIGTVFACFGWGGLLNITQYCYDLCFNFTKILAEFPGANITIPYVPESAYVILLCGLVAIICIRPIKSWIQYGICFACVLISSFIIVIYPAPIFMTTTDNELVAFNDGTNITFNKSRDAKHFFAFNTWKQLCGFSVDTENIRHKNNKGVFKFSTSHANIVYIQKFVPLQENINALCTDENIDYIISYFDIDAPKCQHKILHGGFVIYPSKAIHRTSNNRYWHNHNLHRQNTNLTQVP